MRFKEQRDNIKYCPRCNMALDARKTTKKCKHCGYTKLIILELGAGA